MAVERGVVVYMAGEAVTGHSPPRSGVGEGARCPMVVTSSSCGKRCAVPAACGGGCVPRRSRIAHRVRCRRWWWWTRWPARSSAATRTRLPDVGELVTRPRRVQQALGCAVLFVHHSVKRVSKKKGPVERGSGALRGAADVMMQVARRPGGVVTVDLREAEGRGGVRPIRPADGGGLARRRTDTGRSRTGVRRGARIWPAASAQGLTGKQLAALAALASFGRPVEHRSVARRSRRASPTGSGERTFYKCAGRVGEPGLCPSSRPRKGLPAL